MRDIHVDTIRDRIAEICIEATPVLPEDVREGLRQGAAAKQILIELLDNFDIAER